MILRPWQKELYDFILINKNNPIIRERKIIWVENNKGCTGKSKFQKWLRLGQRNVIRVNYQLVVLKGLYKLLQS